MLDLSRPGVFGIQVCGPIEATEQLSGKCGSSLEIKTQCVGQNGLGDLGHDSILRPDHDAQQAFAADSMTAPSTAEVCGEMCDRFRPKRPLLITSMTVASDGTDSDRV